MKRQGTYWDKTFVNHISNKALGPRIYDTLSKHNCKNKWTVPLENWQRTWESIPLKRRDKEYKYEICSVNSHVGNQNLSFINYWWAHTRYSPSQKQFGSFLKTITWTSMQPNNFSPEHLSQSKKDFPSHKNL